MTGKLTGWLAVFEADLTLPNSERQCIITGVGKTNGQCMQRVPMLRAEVCYKSQPRNCIC